MSFGNILGQIMQNGLGSNSPTQGRLNSSMNSMQQGGGLESILGQLQGAMGGQGGSTGGGLADMARDFLGNKGPGGVSNAQLGGLGALAGGLLGGGVGGAVKGGAMAILGSMALQAIQKSRAASAAQTAQNNTEMPQFAQNELDSVVSSQSEQLALRAMINAAKADGKIDQDELQNIIGQMSKDDVTDAEKQFVMDEIRSPAIDPAELARGIQSPAQAAQIYAASLIAIHLDTTQERDYLIALARALNLDQQTVAQLHQMTGAA